MSLDDFTRADLLRQAAELDARIVAHQAQLTATTADLEAALAHFGQRPRSGRTGNGAR